MLTTLPKQCNYIFSSTKYQCFYIFVIFNELFTNDIARFEQPALGPKVIKLFCSTQLSKKFKLHPDIEIVGSKEVSCLTQQNMKHILLINVQMPTLNKNCWHFNIYEQDKF